MSTVELPLALFIVDDEPPARNRLKELLADCSDQLSLEVVGEAGNGQEALDKLSQIHADVILLDIRMPQMDGIELAQHLNKLPKPPVIIFTTAYDKYAINAFEQRAIDYLLKPIRLGRLFKRRPDLKVHRPSEYYRDLDEQADRLLEKVHREGESSLSPKERRILEDYSRRMRQKHR